MKIGIVCAMEQEIAPLLNLLSNASVYQKAKYKIYIGTLHSNKVALLKSGIGKVSAALGTTLLISSFNPDVIINFGSAGSLIPSLNIGDIIISNEVCYHDVDITNFGYKPGQVANCPVTFIANPSLVLLAEKVTQKTIAQVKSISGMIVSGDIFVNSKEKLNSICCTYPKAIAVEMEAAAIAHVCYQFNMPFIAVRAISDNADHHAHLKFKECIDVAIQNVSILVEKMVKCLSYEN